MSQVFLDCSALHDITVRFNERSIPLDGSYFIQDLKNVLNDFELSQREINDNNFKKKLMLALVNNKSFEFNPYDLKNGSAEHFAEKVELVANAMIKEWDKNE